MMGGRSFQTAGEAQGILDYRGMICGPVGVDELRRMDDGGLGFGGGEWDGRDRGGWMWPGCCR